MWRWLPYRQRIPLAAKLIVLLLFVLIPYVLLPLQSLRSVRDLTRRQQEERMRTIAISHAGFLRDRARQIQDNLEGTTSAEPVARYWSSYAVSATEDAAGLNQAALEKSIQSAQNEAGLDYLALTNPKGDLYLAHGLAEVVAEIPRGSLLREIAGQQFPPLVNALPPRHWQWAIETHPATAPEGAGPFLVVAGPVYLSDAASASGYRYVGCIAGGQKIAAPLLGSPRETETEPTDVILADLSPDILWTTYRNPDEADQLLTTLKDQNLLASPDPRHVGPTGNRHLVSVIRLDQLLDQQNTWAAPLLLIAVQPESQFVGQLSDFQRGLAQTAAASALLAILLGLAFATDLSRSLRRLTVAAGRFAKGERVDFAVPETRDEVETLGEAFVTMVEQREAATQRAIHAEKIAAWQDMARKLAHEIKNPLQPIRLQIESLARTANRNPDRLIAMIPEATEVVLIEVDRLKHLADEFSEFARMPKPLLEPTALAPLVEHVISLMSAQHASIHFAQEVPADLPLLALDREKLTQALMNLIKNAAEALDSDHTAEGAILCSAAVEADGAVDLWVSDNGPGIDAETQEKLFTPYFTTKGEAGTGLGLVMVQSIMADHGGNVWVDSAPGGGTTFTLHFPAEMVVTPQG